MTKIGRPSFSPTDWDREKVRELIAAGTGVTAIAREMGLDRKTLRAKFPDELALLPPSPPKAAKAKKSRRGRPRKVLTETPVAEPPKKRAARRKKATEAEVTAELAPAPVVEVQPEPTPEPVVEAVAEEFQPTEDQRDLVAVLGAAGWGRAEIARAIDVSTSVLRKNFAEELGTGPAKKRAELIAAIYQSAIGGNSASQRMFLALGETAPYEAPEVPAARPAEEPKKQPKLGKKEAAELAAQNPDIGTSIGALMSQRSAQGVKVH